MFHVGDDPMRIGYDRVEDAYTPMYSEDQLSCYCDPENTCPYHTKADVDDMLDSELWSARWEARSNGGW